MRPNTPSRIHPRRGGAAPGRRPCGAAELGGGTAADLLEPEQGGGTSQGVAALHQTVGKKEGGGRTFNHSAGSAIKARTAAAGGPQSGSGVCNRASCGTESAGRRAPGAQGGGSA